MDKNKALSILIIANGEPIATSKLCMLSKSKTILALDGGYHQAIAANLDVDYLLGDFDSLNQAALAQAKKTGVMIHPTPNQDQTDLEKALSFCKKHHYQNIHICSALGKKTDHMLYNIHLLKQFYQKDHPIFIHTNTELLTIAYNQTITLQGHIGDGIAIFGAPKCTVSGPDLKYPLDNLTLTHFKQASVSNALTQNTATLIIDGYALIIQQLTA